MARQPKQIHVFLYRQAKLGYEYAIFQRADMLECWQGVCGGLEDEETPEEGARRELLEEAGIRDRLPLHRLESISYIPSEIFLEEDKLRWGKDTVVIPMYYYAMPADQEIILSEEHCCVEWLEYEDAMKRLYFETQKTALYELNERLKRNNL